MRVRVGLVLGGGGAAGYGWHTGVLRGLAEIAGLDARTDVELVGTSAGAFAAAYLGAGVSGPDLYALAVGEAPSWAGQALFELAGRPGALADAEPRSRRPASPSVLAAAWRAGAPPRIGSLVAGLLPAGTISGEPQVAPLRVLYEHRTWPPAVRICAVRLTDGRREVFDAMSDVGVPDAVLASSAVPGFMQPVELHGQRYVDGSAHTPTNADVLASSGLDVVLISAPMSPPPDRSGLGFEPPLRTWAGRHLRRETRTLVASGARVLTFAPASDVRRRAPAGRRPAAVRGPAARAAYAQVLAAGEALAALLA